MVIATFGIGIFTDKMIAEYITPYLPHLPVASMSSPSEEDISQDSSNLNQLASTSEALSATNTPNDISLYKKVDLQIGAYTVRAMVASDDKSWGQGLSGLALLKQGEGMWFAFRDDMIRDFWMPNMNFPIDIVWVDKNYTVLGAAVNAQPETNLRYPKIFTSPSPARYVLELPAGDVARLHIKNGTKIVVRDINSIRQ